MTHPTELHQPVDADNSTLKVLQEARKLIEKPENWGQGIRPYRENKRSCCAAEAIETVTPWGARSGAFRAIRDAMGVHAPSLVLDWNDTHTHAEVLAAFDRAIEAEQAKGVQP